MAAARAAVVDQNCNKEDPKLRLLIPLARFTESIIALAIAWSGYSVFVLQDFGVFGENHLLENLQAATLFAVLAVYLLPIFQAHRADKLLCMFFVWLTVGFLLREIDVEELNVHAFFVKWGAGSGRNLLLALTLAAMSVMALVRLRFYLDLAKQFVVSEPGVMALKSGVLLIAGDICEKVTFTHHVLFEEVFELVAYAVLLRAATLLARHKIDSKITT